jgi:hypothetical protein
MRLANKQAQNKLDWRILDVEEEEWDRRLAEICGAAANGIPLATAAPPRGLHAQKEGAQDAGAGGGPGFGSRRQVVVIGAAAGLLVALIGWGLWYTAQAGLTRMQAEVANAVMLEEVTSHVQGPAMRAHGSLVAVEFVDGSAMASVLVTRTLAGGATGVYPEVRFYALAAKGWQRTAPVAAFWGPRVALDTASLHFVFGEKDRSVVEQLAPAAEALYTTLRRATGQELAPGGLLTIEFVPDLAALAGVYAGGRVRLRSPLLYQVTLEQRSQLCGRLLRLVLADALLDAARQHAPPKPQWQPMVDGLRTWLWSSAAVQPVLAGGRAGQAVPTALADLQVGAGGLDARLYAVEHQYRQALENQYRGELRSAAVAQLIDFLVASYGIDVLPKLLAGFAEYDDWETLAPAVFGVRAAELEAAWQRAAKGNPR